MSILSTLTKPFSGLMTPAPKKKPAVPQMSTAPTMSSAAPQMSVAPKAPTASYGPTKPAVPAMSSVPMSTAAKPAPIATPAPVMTPKPVSPLTPAPRMSTAPAPNMSTNAGPVYGGPVRTTPAPAPAPIPNNIAGSPPVPELDTFDYGAATYRTNPDASATKVSGNGQDTLPPPVKTSSGTEINPATGGPAKPKPPAIPQYVSEAETAYQQNVALTPEEEAAQAEIDRMQEGTTLGLNKIRDQAIPLDFITGQSASLERRSIALQEPLEKKLARLQAKRTSALEASKFALERADKRMEAEKADQAGKTVGNNIVRLNPETGKYETVYEAPAAKKGPTEVSPGGTLIDENGNVIYQAPFKPEEAEKPQFVTQDGVQYRVGADGALTRAIPVDQTKIDSLPDSPKNILAALEALKTHPGLGAAVGKSSVFNFVPGTSQASFRDKLNSVKALLALPNLGMLKGAMSDKDIAFIQAAGTSLNTSNTEADFNAELDRVIGNIRSIAERTTASQQGIEDTIEMPDGSVYINDGTGNYVPKGKGGAGAASLKVKLPTGETKEGGSASWRNNNPLNIKHGGFAANYGASRGSAATDGGNFAAFPSIAEGLKAARDLLKGGSYAGLPLEQAMRRWSGNGYGADVAPATLRGKTTGQMTDAEINALIQSMARREGWNEGKIYA